MSVVLAGSGRRGAPTHRAQPSAIDGEILDLNHRELMRQLHGVRQPGGDWR
jgi:hypothetical protein